MVLATLYATFKLVHILVGACWAHPGASSRNRRMVSRHAATVAADTGAAWLTVAAAAITGAGSAFRVVVILFALELAALARNTLSPHCR